MAIKFTRKDQPTATKTGGRWKPIAAVSGAVILVLVLGSYVASANYQRANEGKIFPGVGINGIDLGGLTRSEAFDRLKEREQQIQNDGFIFQYNDHQVAISPIIITTADPDLARPIISFDWKRTLDAAEGYGRRGEPVGNLLQIFRSRLSGVRLPVYSEIDRAELRTQLEANFAEFERPAQDARLVIDGIEAATEPEVSGYVIEYDKAIDALAEQVRKFSFSPIVLTAITQTPAIYQAETAGALTQLKRVLAEEPKLSLSYEELSWQVSPTEFLSWIEFARGTRNEVGIQFRQASTTEYLAGIAAEINVPAQDAKFKLENNRVVEFQPSQDGLALQVDETYQQLNAALQSAELGNVPIIVDVAPSAVATGDLNNLGIKELLGTGHSNFSGSPVNRRHNIDVGADTLNGILIPPDQEFSLVDALGEIDGEHGYLQELVIKGDRTIPEYGGGLCQIGTTTFRSALRSGMPIVERRNHSYRVRYYEPAGMDATIYDPAPDFKFLNDTGHHLLLVTRVVGDDVYFELYGTSDGRKVTIEPDPPRIYNVVSPGAPRYVETDELAPGVKKKIESAHAGADTYFKYTITYPDGRIYEKEFSSHYVPWQEVWLVGRDPNATASSTDPITDLPAEPVPPT